MRGGIRRAVVAVGTVVALLGLPAGVASAGGSPAVLAFQPDGHDYGSVPVGQTSEQQLRLTNAGGRGSSALTVTLSGSPAFTVTADTCTGSSLGPGKTCTVTVRFAPAVVGAATATVAVVVRNRAATATAELTGTGGRLGSPAPYSHLYWSMADGSLFIVDKGPFAGKVVSPVVVLPTVNYLAVDDTYLYWSDGSDGSIRRRLLTGGPSTSLATGQNGPEGIAVDATNVYWANLQDGTIKTTPLAGGGAVTTLVDRQPGPIGIAVDASHLYWSTTAGTINRATLAGGSQTQLASVQSNPAGVAVDANNVYWATNNGQLGSSGTISSVPLGGSGPTTATVVVGGQNFPVGVVAYEGHLYWANAGDGTINTLTDGAVNPLFQGLSMPQALAVGP